jgi:cytochrome c-type biogenesis protein CcmH/NrfG
MNTELQVALAERITEDGAGRERLFRIEHELRLAIEQNPSSPEPYVLLGSLYRDHGLNLSAAALFRAALELYPGHERAAAELRTLPFGDIAFVRSRKPLVS